MSKARAIANNSDFPPHADLNGGEIGEHLLQEGNVYNTMGAQATQEFDGGVIS